MSKINRKISSSQRLQSLFLVALVMMALGAFISFAKTQALLPSDGAMTGRAQDKQNVAAETATASITRTSHEMMLETTLMTDSDNRGYNNDYWAIFATDSKGCSAPEVETGGALTFIEIDPNFAPPPPFQAYSNIHSVGSVTLGNHEPVQGQVTYQGSCTNCNNAIVEPEMAEYELSLPNFETYRELALSEADAAGQHLTGDIVWGTPLTDTFPQRLDDRVWYIDGSLTIMSDTWAAIQRGFIYVSGDVNIDGFFYAEELTMMSAGTINILGTLQNQYPYSRTYFPDLFRYNNVVLWSNHDRSASGTGDPCTEPVINIETTISNENPFFSTDNDIGGTILADYGRIHVKANQMNNKVRGALIGDTIVVESNYDSGTETHLQYNGFNFPYQPERLAILTLSPLTITATVGEPFEIPLILQINDGSVDIIDAYLNFDPTYLQLADISTDDYNFHILLNQFDNTSGQIDIEAEYVSDFSYLTLATLTFTATTEIESTTIDFNLSPPRESDVRVLWYDEFSVLSDTIGSTIIINPPPNTPTPTNTPTVTTPTPTPTLTNQPTNTPTPTLTNQPTNTPTNQPTNSPTVATSTPTPTNQPTNTPTNTNTPTPTLTNQPTNTPTNQPTNSPTVATSTPTLTNQPTNTPTNTNTPTPTLTNQPTNTPTNTNTPTAEAQPTNTSTNQPTNSPTVATSTPTLTNQPTNTPTNTNTPTAEAQPTNTPTNQPTNSPTVATSTPTLTNQPTNTSTPTAEAQPTNSPTTEVEATTLPTVTTSTPTSEAGTTSLDNLFFLPMVVK